jgi:hypothetical protein
VSLWIRGLSESGEQRVRDFVADVGKLDGRYPLDPDGCIRAANKILLGEDADHAPELELGAHETRLGYVQSLRFDASHLIIETELTPWAEINVWEIEDRWHGSRLIDKASRKHVELMREYRDTRGILDYWLADPDGYEPDDDSIVDAGPRVDEIDWTGLDEAYAALEDE